MKNWRRFIALLLILIMVFTVIPIATPTVYATTLSNNAADLYHNTFAEKSYSESDMSNMLWQWNFEKLYSHIDQSGKTNSDGYKFLYQETKTSSATNSLYLINKGSDIVMQSNTSATDYDMLTEGVLKKNSSQFEIMSQMQIYIGTYTDRITNTLTINRSTHTFESTYTAQNGSPYFTKDTVSTLLSTTIQLLSVLVDAYVYDELNFGLNGLGFESYYYGGSICAIHQYDSWHKNDALHYHTCSVCHITICGEHIWSADSTDHNTERCSYCEGARSAYIPGSPEPIEVTQTTVQLKPYATYEYSIDGEHWQKEAMFSGLEINTSYKFYQRVAGTPGCFAGKKSEAITITTLSKTNCLNKAVKPILASASHTSISLVAITGYEYRIDNGVWQSSPIFTGLTWGKSYTLYQRIAETSTHKASPISEGIAVKLDMSPSVSFCQRLLSDHIYKYGTKQTNGNYKLTKLVGSTYVSMENTSDGIYCSHYSVESSSSASLKFYFGFYLTPTSKYIEPTLLVEGYYNNNLVSTTTLSASVDRTTYTNSSNIQIPGYANGSDYQKLFNQFMQLVCTGMHIVLLEDIGCGIGGVGFLSFSGEGDESFYCDAALNHQLGNKVLKYGYTATCELQGYTGDYCCSYCGEVVEKGQTTQSMNGHRYNNSCDAECNHCGLMRDVVHIYSNCCDTECDVCGTKREAHHLFNNECDPICTVCGSEHKPSHIFDNSEDMYCNNCGQERPPHSPDDIDGHNYDKEVVVPTCTESGFTLYTCTLCGYSYSANTVPATGHTYAKGVCTICNAKDPYYTIPNPFTDVKESDYFYTPVLWAVQKGITTGISKTSFGPEKPCTRGQVVTFLWRACGSPEPTKTDNPFSDVNESAYYYKAVLWAVEQGITTGISKTAFAPDKTCTRGQVATFLWRAQGKPTPTTTSNPFTDIKEADYYYSAVLWAVEEGITNGTGKGLFSPDKDCTRGQIVTFLYRALS